VHGSCKLNNILVVRFATEEKMPSQRQVFRERLHLEAKEKIRDQLQANHCLATDSYTGVHTAKVLSSPPSDV
jgi:hypothetical protein